MNTASIIGLFKYHSIQNLTIKMKTDHMFSHHMFTHPNSAITHHFFHHLITAVQVLIFSSSMLYRRACLYIGQNIESHKINMMAIMTISRTILNLCIALTKYSSASEISIQELY